METKRYGRFRSLDPLELQIITFLRTKDNANIYSETYSTIAEKISCNDKPKVLSALNFLVRHGYVDVDYGRLGSKRFYRVRFACVGTHASTTYRKVVYDGINTPLSVEDISLTMNFPKPEWAEKICLELSYAGLFKIIENDGKILFSPEYYGNFMPA